MNIGLFISILVTTTFSSVVVNKIKNKWIGILIIIAMSILISLLHYYTNGFRLFD